MSTFSSLKTACLRRRAGITTGLRDVSADDYVEEFDEIESLPFDTEHDEDDRDPEPERRMSPDHAQGHARQRRRPFRSGAREDKSQA